MKTTLVSGGFNYDFWGTPSLCSSAKMLQTTAVAIMISLMQSKYPFMLELEVTGARGDKLSIRKNISDWADLSLAKYRE